MMCIGYTKKKKKKPMESFVDVKKVHVKQPLKKSTKS